MFSLLITLFISLFSISSINNSVDLNEYKVDSDIKISKPQQEFYDMTLQGNSYVMSSAPELFTLEGMQNLYSWFASNSGDPIMQGDARFVYGITTIGLTGVDFSYTLNLSDIDTGGSIYFGYYLTQFLANNWANLSNDYKATTITFSFRNSSTYPNNYNQRQITLTRQGGSPLSWTLTNYFYEDLNNPNGSFVGGSALEAYNDLSCYGSGNFDGAIWFSKASVFYTQCLTAPNPSYYEGYTAGINAGQSIGNQQQYDNGYQAGLDAGQVIGRQEGIEIGETRGYQTGYADGIDYSESTNSTALTIFTGILSVGLLPVNVFLQILNFEVFGINISGFVSAILTISVVVIVLRVVLGNKND